MDREGATACVGEDVPVNVLINADAVVSRLSVGVFHYDGHGLRAGADQGASSDSFNNEDGSTKCGAFTYAGIQSCPSVACAYRCTPTRTRSRWGQGAAGFRLGRKICRLVSADVESCHPIETDFPLCRSRDILSVDAMKDGMTVQTCRPNRQKHFHDGSDGTSPRSQGP